MFATISVLIVVHAFCTTGSADVSALESWFAATAQQQPSPEAGHEFVFRVVWGDVRDAQQIPALETEVAGKPDHLKRALLDNLKILRDHGRPVSEMRLIVGPEGAWRLCESTGREKDVAPANPQEFHDVGQSGSVVWSLTSGQLGIVPADQPPPGYDYADLGGEARRTVEQFLTQGLSITRAPGTRLEPALLDGASWRRSGSRDNGHIRYTIHGTWDAAAGQGRVTRWVFFEPAASEAGKAEAPVVAETWRVLEGAAPDGCGGSSTVAGFERIDADGRVKTRRELIACRTVELDEVRRVAAVPAPGATDPIRGEVRPRRIVDFVSNLTSESAESSPSKYQPVGPAYDGSPPGATGRGFRPFGWGVLALLVGAWIWIRTVGRRKLPG